MVGVAEHPPEVELRPVRVAGRGTAWHPESGAATRRRRTVVGSANPIDVLERHAAAQVRGVVGIGRPPGTIEGAVEPRLTDQHLERAVRSAEAEELGADAIAVEGGRAHGEVDVAVVLRHVGEARILHDPAFRLGPAATAIEHLGPPRHAEGLRGEAAARPPELAARDLVGHAGVDVGAVADQREDHAVVGVAHSHGAVVAPRGVPRRVRVGQHDRIVGTVRVERVEARAAHAHRRGDEHRPHARLVEAGHGAEAHRARRDPGPVHRIEVHAVAAVEDVPLQHAERGDEEVLGAVEVAHRHPPVAELARRPQQVGRLEGQRP